MEDCQQTDEHLAKRDALDCLDEPVKAWLTDPAWPIVAKLRSVRFGSWRGAECDGVGSWRL